MRMLALALTSSLLAILLTTQGCSSDRQSDSPTTTGPETNSSATPINATSQITTIEQNTKAGLNVSQGFQGELSTAAGDDFLPVEEAFRLDAITSGRGATLIWTIAPEYYLYKHKFAISAQGDDISDQVSFSDGISKTDDYFGKVEVYFHQAIVEIDDLWPESCGDLGGCQPVALSVSSQGCAEAGLCYPVQTEQLTLSPPHI